jgi:hypothetical protein
MVAKVVVGVVDTDIEDNSPPEFFEILIDRGSVALNQVHKVEITRTCFGSIAVLIPKPFQSA